MRRGLLLLSTLLVVLAVASAASANKPTREIIPGQADVVFTADQCGFEVLGHIEGGEIITTFTDRAGNAVKQIVVFPGNKATLTNARHGQVDHNPRDWVRIHPASVRRLGVLQGDGSRVVCSESRDRRARDLVSERPRDVHRGRGRKPDVVPRRHGQAGEPLCPACSLAAHEKGGEPALCPLPAVPTGPNDASEVVLLDVRSFEPLQLTLSTDYVLVVPLDVPSLCQPAPQVLCVYLVNSSVASFGRFEAAFFRQPFILKGLTAPEEEADTALELAVPDNRVSIQEPHGVGVPYLVFCLRQTSVDFPSQKMHRSS